MKKTLLSVFASGIILIACAQNVTTPKVVQDAFLKMFKSAQNVKWEQEDNEWEAEFKMDATKMSACFDNAGKWLETETHLKMKDLPAEIHKAINLKFSGWEMEEIEGIEKPDFKGYEIELENGETETEIIVSSAGEITIKKVTVEDDDKDDDKD